MGYKYSLLKSNLDSMSISIFVVAAAVGDIRLALTSYWQTQLFIIANSFLWPTTEWRSLSLAKYEIYV